MTSSPWDADRPLSLETARAVAQSVLPVATAASLRPLGSGWDFDAYVTDDGWVIRFPRRAESERLLDREGPVLDLVRPALPSSVSVPAVRVHEHGVQDFPYRIGIHPFIAGVPADEVGESQQHALARSLGEVLSALHSIPGSSAREAGLRELDRSEPGRMEWIELGSAGLATLRGPGLGLDDALQWLRELEDPLRRLEGPVLVIHHDLSAEHLLANERTGRVVGVLDWTDAILGDPARDFVPLVAFGGWSFVEEVLGHYDPDLDPGFRSRLRFMARLLPLMWLGHAHTRGEEVGKHVAWVKNAFAGQSAS